MNGDFSRWTFAPADGYRSVLLQQGRVLLDADWNEQGAITARHDEVRTRDVVGRAGGPADGAAFAVTDGTGTAPSGTPWADLRLGPGRFYVGGVLTEVAADDTTETGTALGPALADQPFLRVVGALPGLPEPGSDGRYAVVVDVWTRHVTAEEEPRLLESALGGPDTTTRAQTVWQVRLQAVGAGDVCSSLTGAAWLDRTPPTMTASLTPVPPSADPCLISTSAGYRRLENQLYRVQVSAVDPGTGEATYVWSRENGSVVAGLVQIASPSATDAVLHLDREGRDTELSFHAGDLVEVTSRDRELHGLPALLGTAGVPDGLRLPVTWLGPAGSDPGTADVANLGDAPVVRRWEGGPTVTDGTVDELEDGIQVAFGAGEYRVGDHWLVPARTVRLVYGVSVLGGTIEWPEVGGVPQPQPPLGPQFRSATLAVLERTTSEDAAAWTLVSDCRLLTPALTQLVTIDLLGGDGQESLPGQPLDGPVRVAVRNGCLAVVGAHVWFTAPDGHLSTAGGVPTTDDPPEVRATTDGSGHAEVRWLLGGAEGAVTQVCTAQLLDDAGEPVGAQVQVTARRSIASQVAWDPVCEGFGQTGTVQDALAQLATTADLRLLGGDGQQVTRPGTTVPHEVRVVLDSPCGPVRGAIVAAQATEGGRVVPARPGEANPGSLPERVGAEAETETDEHGVAAFWWQPDVAQRPSDVLDVLMADTRSAPVRVSAHRSTARGDGGRTGGVHITGLRFADGSDFVNDEEIAYELLARGIHVELDAPVVPESIVIRPPVVGRVPGRSKPVVRVLLELPWPLEGDGDAWWPGEPIGTRQMEVEADLAAKESTFVWTPTDRAQSWLLGQLREILPGLVDRRQVVGRFVVDGWAIVSADDPSQHLNGHARTVLERQSGATRFVLPTDDEVTGGQFVQWFRLARE